MGTSLNARGLICKIQSIHILILTTVNTVNSVEDTPGLLVLNGENFSKTLKTFFKNYIKMCMYMERVK